MSLRERDMQFTNKFVQSTCQNGSWILILENPLLTMEQKAIEMATTLLFL
jgi:hypothetical protein